MRITLKGLANKISEIGEVNIHDVNHVLKILQEEIEFELLQGNKFSIPGIISIYPSESKYNSRYSKKLKCHVKVENKIRLKCNPSDSIIRKLNFNKKD